MKKYKITRKMDRELVEFVGTDIPPMTSREMMILGTLDELKQKLGEDIPLILSLSDIFEGYTFSKRRKFEIISRMVKDKIIKKKAIGSKKYLFSIIPTISWRHSEEIRIYKNLEHHEKIELRKHLMKK